MKTYADLDLRKIRDECGLDFARHTYSRNQCSCCYGPEDMGAQWWAKGKKPKKINVQRDNNGKVRSFQWDRDLNEIPYILFKNAENVSSGRIKSLSEPVEDDTCISYHFSSLDQKIKVCQMLQEQLGDEYRVLVPENEYTCIILLLGEIYPVAKVMKMIEKKDYRLRNGSWFYFDVESEKRKEEVSFDALLHNTKYQYVIRFEKY